MATKLFLRNTTLNALVDSAIAAIIYDMVTTAGAGVDTAATSSTSGSTEIQLTKSAGGSSIAWVSGRVPAGGFTLTTSDVSAWFREQNMNNNCGGRLRVYKYSGGVLTELGGGPFDDGVEFGTSDTEMTWVSNVTDTAFAEDDRIVVKLFLTNIGTMGTGTSTMSFNAADAATGDSFFNINENVTFKSENVSGTLNNTLADLGTNTLDGDVIVAGTLSKTLDETTLKSGTAHKYTQLSSTDGLLPGKRYRDFSNKAITAHSVAKITQLTSFIVNSPARRYGSFAGRISAAHTVGKITQLTSYTANGPMRRYGSFAGKSAGQTFGSLSQTLADVTPTITGKVDVVGTLAKTLADTVLTAAGTSTRSGTLAQTLDPISTVLNGTVPAQGTLTKTLDATTLAAFGTSSGTPISGSASITLGDATLSGAGQVRVAGSLARLLDDVAVVTAGQVTVAGSLIQTLEAITGSLTVAIPSRGTLTQTISITSVIQGTFEIGFAIVGVRLDDVLAHIEGEEHGEGFPGDRVPITICATPVAQTVTVVASKKVLATPAVSAVCDHPEPVRATEQTRVHACEE